MYQPQNRDYERMFIPDLELGSGESVLIERRTPSTPEETTASCPSIGIEDLPLTRG